MDLNNIHRAEDLSIKLKRLSKADAAVQQLIDDCATGSPNFDLVDSQSQVYLFLEGTDCGESVLEAIVQVLDDERAKVIAEIEKL
jgi:hypothetical protein